MQLHIKTVLEAVGTDKTCSTPAMAYRALLAEFTVFGNQTIGGRKLKLDCRRKTVLKIDF
jgi:hypothetical protein